MEKNAKAALFTKVLQKSGTVTEKFHNSGIKLRSQRRRIGRQFFFFFKILYLIEGLETRGFDQR